MPDYTANVSLPYPVPADLIKSTQVSAKLADDIKALATKTDVEIGRSEARAVEASKNALKVRTIDELPAKVDDWVGVELQGVFPIPAQATVDAIVGHPVGSGLAVVTIEPLASGGNVVRWAEYGGQGRTWTRTVSSTGNSTPWKRLDVSTRKVMHQLSTPGAPSLTDAEPTRHVRLPLRVPAFVDSFDLTFKNFNDRSGTNFGDLTFSDVYIAKRAKDTSGAFTANYAEPPTNLGTPVYTGSGNGRRYRLVDVSFPLEANVEYIIGYAYTDADSSPNHLGIGGSYLGTNPLGVGSMSVSNTWSQYTPLDVYLNLNAAVTSPTIMAFGSSSETGLHSDYPLRDSWIARVAEDRGALLTLFAQSGQTLEGLASGFIWTKQAAMAPVDEVWICAGSNDVYLGATLDQMKARFNAVLQKARALGAQRFIATTIFPRAQESDAVRTIREAYNAWLRSVPPGVNSVYDRVKAVTDETTGLMRADFDSGDRTHLNTQGQAYLGATVINPTLLLL